MILTRTQKFLRAGPSRECEGGKVRKVTSRAIKLRQEMGVQAGSGGQRRGAPAAGGPLYHTGRRGNGAARPRRARTVSAAGGTRELRLRLRPRPRKRPRSSEGHSREAPRKGGQVRGKLVGACGAARCGVWRVSMGARPTVSGRCPVGGPRARGQARGRARGRASFVCSLVC